MRSFNDKEGLHLHFPYAVKPEVRLTGFVLKVTNPISEAYETVGLPSSVSPSRAYANYNDMDQVLTVTIPHNPETAYCRELYVAQHD
jgi:hypothetical protein